MPRLVLRLVPRLVLRQPPRLVLRRPPPLNAPLGYALVSWCVLLCNTDSDLRCVLECARMFWLLVVLALFVCVVWLALRNVWDVLELS